MSSSVVPPPAAPGRRTPLPRRARWVDAACLLALAAACLLTFADVARFDFVSWDDPQYITKNPHVAGGLTASGLRWALTASGGYYWHPLTWMSHMVDVELFGLAPGPHHVTGLLLHLAATLLLYGVLRRLTGAQARSALVAALFALHPLHVESVAWVAERKDVLSAVCWMATLWAYARYATQPTVARYALIAVCFALGLMAKPMVVTLPAVLLLLDVWPLKRLPLDGAGPVAQEARRLIYEKLPLVALSLLSAVVTVLGQLDGGAVRSVNGFPLSLRLANALVSYVAYIGKMLWPSGLAAFYPYPDAVAAWQWCGAAAILVGLSVAAWRARRRFPYVLVGWAWYLLVLLPVIGILQVGDQAMADRFTYLPLVGLFVVVAWGATDLLAGRRGGQVALAAAALLVVGGSLVVAREQVGYWKDSLSLWQRAAAVTRNNERAHVNLAMALQERGRTDEAIHHYQEAGRLLALEASTAHVPPVGAAAAHDNAGLLLMEQGRTSEAAGEFAAAVRLTPEDPDLHHNLAVALDALGRRSEAAEHHRRVARLKPADAASQEEACLAEATLGRLAEAIPACLEAVRLDPRQPDWHYNVALMFLQRGQAEEAAEHLRTALLLNPRFDEARKRLQALGR